jgi:hypothetical protein
MMKNEAKNDYHVKDWVGRKDESLPYGRTRRCPAYLFTKATNYLVEINESSAKLVMCDPFPVFGTLYGTGYGPGRNHIRQSVHHGGL